MLKISLEKCKKLLKNRRVTIPAAIVLVAIIAGAVIAVQNSSRTNAATDKPQTTVPGVVKATGPTSPKIEETKTESSQTTQVATPQSQASAQSKTPQSNTSAHASTPPPKSAPAPEPPRPLYVHSLFTVGGDTWCENSSLRIGFNEISINLHGDTAGTLNWQIEERKSGVVSIGRTGSVPLAAGQPFYDLSVNDYYMLAPNSDYAIRMHITSPSEAATSWYAPEISGSCGSY